MKIQIKHTGIIKNGKPIWDLPDLYQQQMWELEGKQFTMTIKETHKKVTMSQHNFYRGIILPVCYESEFFRSYDNKDQIHDEYFAPRFLGYKKMIDLPAGKQEIMFIRSLADFSITEMADYITKVIALCETELGINIPNPEMAYNKFYNNR